MKFLTAATILSIALTGCATATLVESEPGKKVVVSESPRGNPEARQKALAIAQMECNGKKPVLVKQGRVVTGSQTSGESTQTPEQQKQYNLFTGKSKTVTSQQTSTSSKTENTYEWQLTFECQ
jgi:hypothetical protein